MQAIVRFFVPDTLRHEGVRPVQVWGLRLFFLLMLLMVAPGAWGALLRHQGAWDPGPRSRGVMGLRVAAVHRGPAYSQPGTAAACLIHSRISGVSASSTLRIFT